MYAFGSRVRCYEAVHGLINISPAHSYGAFSQFCHVQPFRSSFPLVPSSNAVLYEFAVIHTTPITLLFCLFRATPASSHHPSAATQSKSSWKQQSTCSRAQRTTPRNVRRSARRVQRHPWRRLRAYVARLAQLHGCMFTLWTTISQSTYILTNTVSCSSIWRLMYQVYSGIVYSFFSPSPSMYM